MGTTVEATTLWDLFWEPSLTLHLPHFALFLIVAFILELIVSRKKVCLYCTVPTVIFLLLTGIGGIVAITLMLSAHIYIGTRAIMPIWYYPVTVAFIFVAIVFFMKGAKSLLKERLIYNCSIRCLIFVITVYFSIVTLTTPIKVNASIEAWETTEQAP
ncbi:hypothetical protein P4C99_16515 [Pontiellaceae bacterium B1224]|nr:hypothetical protein [Pontiellaceae bacterium B1224]